MNASVGKVIAELGRTLGKALLAGVGVEIAKVAGAHMKKRLGPRDGAAAKEDPPPPTADEVQRENEKLREEIEKLREELAAARR